MHLPHAVVVLVRIRHERFKSGDVRKECTKDWWFIINIEIAQGSAKEMQEPKGYGAPGTRKFGILYQNRPFSDMW